ncbi:DUF5687 family protein [Dokdonia pacifica]|uniref:ABC-2 type transport system permease protein n=1 Tax=Dokdonia pacifica TaxID=1627892 RepID=A0A238WGZ8_9FLAO|nr:DUF5687 family protein [Dokdonia pacifica]SNR45862.1 hypothetical protein SAMN06265376_1011073 [Dokdonia pacifica]
MIKRFLNLEWKAFFRSASFKVNVFLKILMGLGALYFIFVFAGLGIGLYFGLEKSGYEPLVTLNKFLIYYFVADLIARYFFQKMPVVNIKPMLLMPFKKSKIVNFALGKTALSFFNIIHAFFFIPFSIILLTQGFSPLGVIGWHLGIMALIYMNNFINVFLNDETVFVVLFGAVFVILGGLQYYGYFDITTYTGAFFQGLYEMPWLAIIPILVVVGVAYYAFTYFLKRLYLDAGLSKKTKTATTENMEWLDRFGKGSTFLKNDLKLILRNKRSKTTVFLSVLFLFYGLLFFGDAIEVYSGPFWRMFAAVFVTGGFLFSFGQFVPSWDSAYYPLMMTQNIRYKEYLRSKWLLVVIATGISSILAIPYVYFGWEVLAAIFVGAIFNMGVNAHLVLLGGAYIKTPIDLTSGKKAFGDKSAFNIKTLLISMPKMLGPMALYAIGHFTLGPVSGFALVAIAGLAGFAFRDKVFNMIIKIYKKEKYKTLQAYKQNN